MGNKKQKRKKSTASSGKEIGGEGWRGGIKPNAKQNGGKKAS